MDNFFILKSKFQPAGDQPQAIAKLVEGLSKGYKYQTLLGVTGSGKTFTIANVIAKMQLPTLVIAHNKTLAAQLCQEFRDFFPENAVEYFISYYDYYQPEAYLPTSDTYIDKEALINEEIDRLRHSATQAILTRKDVIVVASVSCIYNLGSPEAYESRGLILEKGRIITREDLLRSLVEMQYLRTNEELKRGSFRWRGETLEIMPSNASELYKIWFSNQTIEKIEKIDPLTRKILGDLEKIFIFPNKHFFTLAHQDEIIEKIKKELNDRVKFFQKQKKFLEAERLERRTKFDLELIKEIGYCHGIENYSRYFDGRAPGEPPLTLLDYFIKSFNSRWLIVIDESHVTLPQIRGMYEGDLSRKKTLVEYGFRLPSALDNRPLKYEEFKQKLPQVIFTSATPGEEEIKMSQQVVEQIIRPTGLVDPEVFVIPMTKQIRFQNKNFQGYLADLLPRIEERVKNHERVLITTLTKRTAEDLSEFLKDQGLKAEYLHSDLEPLDRLKILLNFRKGKFDILVGVNLLREGLDLPEVSLVAILDADKEGFLRSTTSLIQTIGRAARNVHGQVVLYADEITSSIKQAVEETNRRRQIQLAYNEAHKITPQSIKKEQKNLLQELSLEEEKDLYKKSRKVEKILELDLIGEDKQSLDKIIQEKEKQMKEAAALLEFELAALLRDEIKILKRKARTRGRAL